MKKATPRGGRGAKIGTAIAVGAVAAAAAGYYFYGSARAKQHRAAVAKWAGDMKRDVMKEAKHLKSVNAENFAKVVDAVAETYQGVRSIKTKDLKRAADELKSNWKMVKGELARGKKKVKKIVAKKT